jgi:glycosyltransferase involved in cell wall biosynthesis
MASQSGKTGQATEKFLACFQNMPLQPIPGNKNGRPLARDTVSVIIPAYNYARFLPLAIDSVLAQTILPAEVLVIDDGSTDNTAELVAARYGSNPLVRYIRQPNAGLSAARNTGIKNACGEFVAFLDADDEWMPDFLREAMARFVQLPPTFAVVATRSTIITAAGTPLPRKQLLEDTDREFTCADIILKTRFSPSATVVRRSVFAECGNFDTSLRSSEDRDMWIRIAAQYRIYLCGRQLVLFRRHGNSMSTHSDRMKMSAHHTFAKARHNSHITGLPLFFWYKVKSFLYFQTAWMYFEDGRPGAALRDLLVSFLFWPWFNKRRELNEPILFRLRTLRYLLFTRIPRRKP